MIAGERAKVVAALVLVQVSFAVHYVAAKVLLESIDPAAWSALRVLSAAAILLAVHATRPVAISGGDLARLAVYSLFGVVINQVCFIEGLARTTASHSALINTTIPVATLGFAVLLGKEKLRRAQASGIVLALAGVLTLLRLDDLDVDAAWFAGDLLTLLNAASFSLFLVLSRDTIRRVGSLPATAGILCFGSLGVACWGGPAAARVDFAGLPGTAWLIAAFIVLFPTVLAYFLNYWALARVDSSEVALFIYLQPVLAAGLSVIWLGEQVGTRLVVSSALVFLGVLFATRDLGTRRPTVSGEDREEPRRATA
ncbi:MAG: DMT family transporter [Candidatus Eiseniibacteriota bacterium]